MDFSSNFVQKCHQQRATCKSDQMSTEYEKEREREKSWKKCRAIFPRIQDNAILTLV